MFLIAEHWVADHPALLQRLTAALAPGGQLAVQMPMADELVTHRTAYALARSAEFPRSSAARPRRQRANRVLPWLSGHTLAAPKPPACRHRRVPRDPPVGSKDGCRHRARSRPSPRRGISATPVRAVPFPPTGRPFSSGEERNPPATE